MLHTKFNDNQPTGLGEDFWQVFILYGQPSWSCDLDPASKLLFPHPMDAPHEIWLQSGQWFQRKRCLKMLTDNRLQMTDYRQQMMTTEASHTISSPVSLRLRWAKNDFSTFWMGTQIWPYQKKCQRSSLDHHLNRLGRPSVPNAIYQDTGSKFVVFLFLEKIFNCFFFFVFLPYMGMVAILFNIVEPFEQTVNIPSTEGSMLNLVKIGQVVSEKKMFKDNIILNMYIAKGQGSITTRGQKFDCI